MRKLIGIQLRIMFQDKKYVLSFCLMLIFALIFPLCDSFASLGEDRYNLRNAYMLFSVYDGFNFSAPVYMAYVASLLSVFSFSDSFLLERQRGSLPVIYTRCRPIVYYSTREVAVFVGAFLLVLLPLLVNAGAYLLAFGTDGLQTRNGMPFIQNTSGLILPKYLFYDLFLENPYLYCLLHILLFSLFFGLAATAVCSVSFFWRGGRLPLICSVFALSLCMTLIENIPGLPVNFSYLSYIIAGSYRGGQRELWVLIAWFFLFVAVIVISTLLAGRRKDELLR